MKMKEIIPELEAEKIEDDVCLLCETHERAYKHIQDGISCPFCGTVQRIVIDDYSVVGMSNYYSTTSTTGEPLCDKCTHWTGYCMMNKYSYKKISCYNYRRRS